MGTQALLGRRGKSDRLDLRVPLASQARKVQLVHKARRDLQVRKDQLALRDLKVPQARKGLRGLRALPAIRDRKALRGPLVRHPA